MPHAAAARRPRSIAASRGGAVSRSGGPSATDMMTSTLLAVNGTLMRGLELNPNLVAVGATFVREDATEQGYRLWSIGDRHPPMQRTPGEGASIAVELWDVPLAGL